MCNYKHIYIHDIEVSIEMTLKYILVYHKILSVHLAVHFNHISSNCEITLKDILKSYLSG